MVIANTHGRKVFQTFVKFINLSKFGGFFPPELDIVEAKEASPGYKLELKRQRWEGAMPTEVQLVKTCILGN
jgi:hypothetical protein